MRTSTKDYSTQIDKCLELLKEFKPLQQQIGLLKDKKEQVHFAVYYLLKNKILTSDQITKQIGGHPSYPHKLYERVSNRLQRKAGDKHE